MVITSPSLQLSKGTPRQSLGLYILPEETSFTRAVKTERSGFGTAILVNVSVYVINLGDEGCSLMHAGAWIFIGLPNLVKAWNAQSDAVFSLDGPVGQVYAMIFYENGLFAGTQSGEILI